MRKNVPFSQEQIDSIIKTVPTPFHLYIEKDIIENANKLKQAFSWNEGFKEFFAVKATPNPFLLKILGKLGFGTDCSSNSELLLSEKTGIAGEEIMFSSNNTAAEDFSLARKVGAIINLDDLTHLDFLEKNAGLPDLLCFRYNPGDLKTGNTIIGHPKEAKYGLTREQIFEAYASAKNKGVKRFGIHTMVASNELNPKYFIETAQMLFTLVVELSKKLDIEFEFVNIGGGIGIPYKQDEKPVDITIIAEGVKEKYDTLIKGNNLHPIKLFLECGRVITGPYGYLVSKVLHIKKTYKKYAGLDACMTDLMRPALYGAYHHITVLKKENRESDTIYDVTGSLCENNDKFAIDRKLPELVPGDVVVIHDTGAHGHSMGFNYNGKLRSAEILLRKDGSVEKIRRAESVNDYFATLDFDRLETFTV